MHHVMFDIETLDTRPTAVVLSIAAVVFEPLGTGHIQTFYGPVDTRKQQTLGRTIDADTVLWWLRQDDRARAEVTGANCWPLADYLKDLSSFFDRYPVEAVWGNGSDFDNAIVASLYDSARIPAPWKFYQNRCFRTLRQLFPQVEAPEFEGTQHNALDDACHQAKWCQAILREISK